MKLEVLLYIAIVFCAALTMCLRPAEAQTITPPAGTAAVKPAAAPAIKTEAKSTIPVKAPADRPISITRLRIVRSLQQMKREGYDLKSMSQEEIAETIAARRYAEAMDLGETPPTFDINKLQQLIELVLKYLPMILALFGL
jgi:hypothetical protein